MNQEPGHRGGEVGTKQCEITPVGMMILLGDVILKRVDTRPPISPRFWAALAPSSLLVSPTDPLGALARARIGLTTDPPHYLTHLTAG